MSVSIYVWGTTPANPSSLDLGSWVQYVPFSTGPNGQSSLIRVTETVPGTGSAHLELWDLTNQISFAELAPLWIVDDASGNNIFTGIVQKVKASIIATYRYWTVDAVDLNWLTDTTLVGVPDGSNWEVTSTSSGPVATNVDPAATATNPWTLLPAYWQYGIAVDVTTYVDRTISVPGSIEPTFDRVTLRNAIDQLAGGAGPLVTWWLDQGSGHDFTGTVNLHWTTFASVTNVAVIGAGTIIDGWGWLNGGPLTMLFPYGQPNAIPAGGVYTAPYALTDTNPDHLTSWDYENFSLEVDYTGYRFSLYVRGATDYTTTVTEVSPGPPPVYGIGAVETGGTGWVGVSGDGGSSWLSDFYDAPNATDHAARNAYGSRALRAMQVPIVRGTADVIGSFTGLWHAGQSLSVTSTPLGIANADFFIMSTTTTFMSGTDLRRVALQWGTAAKLNMALRAQAKKAAQTAPQKGATSQLPTTSAPSVTAGQTAVISTQLVNSAGQPWPIPGKVVNWSCIVYDSTGTDVTATTTFTLTPTSSTTDASGKASTTLTTDPAVTGVSYVVTATTPA